jgi:hypothetical protein
MVFLLKYIEDPFDMGGTTKTYNMGYVKTKEEAESYVNQVGCGYGRRVYEELKEHKET